jgi:tRNA (cmo5U34)-methyltransferase
MTAFEGIDAPIVVDLGAGSGHLLEKLLTRFPAAHGIYIDYSDDFLRVAEKRLSRFGGRIALHRASFLDDWEAKITRPPDVIVSMSAIHHLDGANKKKLYAKCFNALTAGGWLFNIDEMKTLREDSYVKSMEYWVHCVDAARSSIPADLLPCYEEWMKRFRSWKKRNIDLRGGPKAEGDDIHESYSDQMQWLEEIGFRDVDLYTKYHLWCTIGGRRPA